MRALALVVAVFSCGVVRGRVAYVCFCVSPRCLIAVVIAALAFACGLCLWLCVWYWRSRVVLCVVARVVLVFACGVCCVLRVVVLVVCGCACGA